MLGTISLETLGGGVALEKFKEELTKVVENILDPNTEPMAKRTIVLTVTVKPTRDRSDGAIDISCQAKLAPATSVITRAFFGKQGQQFLAFEDNPRQVTIEQFVEQAQEKITPIGATKQGGKS